MLCHSFDVVVPKLILKMFDWQEFFKYANLNHTNYSSLTSHPKYSVICHSFDVVVSKIK